MTPAAPSWLRLACSHCSDKVWRPREAPNCTTVVCRLCIDNPQRVQTCEVCFDSCLPFPLTCGVQADRKRFDGRPTSAKHPVCGECLGSWVAACLDDGRHEVQCPNAEGSILLPDTHMRKLASNQLWEALLNRRSEAGIGRLLRMMGTGGGDGEGFAHWASGKTQACPRCFALVERSEGCNHMHCRCGADFCWICGKHPCNTPHGRGDLPVISLPLTQLPETDTHAMEANLHAPLGESEASMTAPALAERR